MFVRRIAVIGTGYVGLTTGACLASLGHEVVCADVDIQKIARLRHGDVLVRYAGKPVTSAEEFRATRQSEKPGAPPQPLEVRRGGRMVAVDPRAGEGRQPGNVDEVLDGKRHACQRSHRVPLSDHCVDRRGTGSGAVSRHRSKSVEPLVVPLDDGQSRLDDLVGAALASSNCGGDVGGGRNRTHAVKTGAGSVSLWRGDLDAAQRYVDRSYSLAEANGMGPLMAIGRSWTARWS